MKVTDWRRYIPAEMRGRIIRVTTNKKEPNVIYCGRKSAWGNPYKISYRVTREMAIEKFGEDVARMSRQGRKLWLQPLIDHVKAGGKLACWCNPLPCHVDVLMAYICRYIQEDEKGRPPGQEEKGQNGG